MPFITTIPASEASGAVRKLYERQANGGAFLPNYAKVFCHHPEVMQAWAELQETIRQQLDSRTYALIILAAALAINNSYCALVQGTKLLARYFSAAELLAIVQDSPASPLSEAERAMMLFARQVAVDSSTITAQEIERLRALGITDRKIFDIAAAAAARCFFGKLPDALGVQPDPHLGAVPEPLLSLLSVGRTVATEAAETMPELGS